MGSPWSNCWNDRRVIDEGTAGTPAGAAETPVRQERGVRGAVAAIRRLVTAINENDEAKVEAAVLALSRRSRWLAPLAFVVGALVMLFQGVRLLLSNWRLTLVQLLPAVWIWLAMLDLKLHLLHGKSFHILRGPILIPVILAIAAVTAASFFLNAVFAFAIARPGPPEIAPAFAEARAHWRTVLAWGSGIGLALGFAVMISTRWGKLSFSLSLGIVVALMMVTYVSVPARLVGIKKSESSRRDKLTASAVGGAIGGVISSPPYAIGRIGIILLGGRYTFIPGIILLVVGILLQTGALGAVKAVKMSAKLVGNHRPADAATSPEPAEDGTPAAMADAGTTTDAAGGGTAPGAASIPAPP